MVGYSDAHNCISIHSHTFPLVIVVQSQPNLMLSILDYSCAPTIPFPLQVHHVRLFAGEEIYSDLYLTVCEWPNDHSKIVIFGFK